MTIRCVVAVSTGIRSRSAPACSACRAGVGPAADGAHAQRVGDGDALEAQVVAQQVVHLGRQAGGHARRDGGQVEVAQHHRGRVLAKAASKGGRSCASSSASEESSTGKVSWLSLVAAPWPGKCLTVETTPGAS